ncbi:response regulator [Polyangium sp. 6x1]|uniref:response regulator n=1 Tax=Polyangium sp. 6x1 TaxID=3042689 RepID=UPI00248259F9|nr:response regulator [Polyangium sp. 6x1]MDI1452095.1 response regulator [Polyangium sp. 6x1]
MGGTKLGKRSRPTVLIVDDDDEIRYSMRNLLVVSDFDVLLAADGVEALKLLERHHVDALVIDLMMPRLDGVGVLRALLGKPAEERPGVVIVVSAHVELRRRIMGLDVRRVFPKPFDALALVNELSSAFSAESTRDKPSEPTLVAVPRGHEGRPS